jgi:hypothetical protein
MDISKIILCAAIATLASMNSYSQDCKNFHKSNDCYVYVPLDRDFQIYNQAKSNYVELGKPMIYKVILYGKKDFIVGVCAEAAYYRQIRLRIIDGITKKLLFDNKDFDYIESFGFSIEKTQPLDLEVTVLSKEKTPPKTKICVGFQILWSNPVETDPKNKK